MAKFRMRPKEKIIGEDLYPSDIIVVEAPNHTQINTNKVREALKSQLNKQMRCVYHDSHWKIEEI